MTINMISCNIGLSLLCLLYTGFSLQMPVLLITIKEKHTRHSHKQPEVYHLIWLTMPLVPCDAS
jgi:hypothetical protein